MKSNVSIINVSELDKEWNWLASSMKKNTLEWFHFSSRAFLSRQRFPFRIHLARLLSGCAAVLKARSADQAILVAHGPRPAMYTAFFARLLSPRTPLLAYSFNYTDLPTGMAKLLMRSAFRKVDRFVVFSNAEKSLYSEYFSIPAEKIDMLHWGVALEDENNSTPPLIDAEYVCAVGSQGRDYATLFAAMRRIPTIKLVTVVHPENIAGLDIPENVEVRTSIPLQQAKNIMAHSQFMVLPLKDSKVPCGHVTAVSAMHMKKAIVCTDSVGIHDYVRHGENGLLVPAKDPVALAAAIQELASHRPRREKMAASSHFFSTRNCNEQAVGRYFENYLKNRLCCTNGEQGSA